MLIQRSQPLAEMIDDEREAWKDLIAHVVLAQGPQGALDRRALAGGQWGHHFCQPAFGSLSRRTNGSSPACTESECKEPAVPWRHPADHEVFPHQALNQSRGRRKRWPEKFGQRGKRSAPIAAQKQQRSKVRHGQLGPTVTAHLGANRAHEGRDGFEDFRRTLLSGPGRAS